ncbi:hypothetical protein B0H15DRAFT_830600, partial [Mycena belliarum]
MQAKRKQYPQNILISLLLVRSDAGPLPQWEYHAAATSGSGMYRDPPYGADNCARRASISSLRILWHRIVLSNTGVIPLFTNLNPAR